jgi:site-specific DNA-methyltransferase (adenine-specific)
MRVAVGKPSQRDAVLSFERSKLFHADCIEWLDNQAERSVHAVVTDPPYGLVEYTAREQKKLRSGRGGVWRMPPSFDGHTRAPLPRFTTLKPADLEEMHAFFAQWAKTLRRVLVPGAHVVVASNPLVEHIVASALSGSGLEHRGTIVRLVMTMRGGDRPKNAHTEFSDVSVMPRSMWEPWLLLREPLDGRVQDNLRKWQTGGLRRVSDDKPFGDVIPSHPTRAAERSLAPHPSLKPQSFLRKVVRAVLPLGAGTILDPFAGAGSTLAAANAVGYASVGVELDPHYVEMAVDGIPKLTALAVP